MANNKEILKLWKEHCDMVQQSTLVDANDSPQTVEERIKRARKDYNFYVNYYFPHYAKVESAKFHIEAANKIKKTNNLKGLFEWHRGGGKSVHMDVLIPSWLYFQETPLIYFMVLVGKSEESATKLLADLQAEFQYNQRLINDFGEQYNSGSWEDGKFVTKGGLACFSLGRGQSPRGLRHRDRRPDYIVIDDIDDDQMVRNESRVNTILDWVLEALFGAMDMGRGRFIMVGNRIHKKSVLAKFSELKGIFHTKVNIIDKNGLPSWDSKYTLEEIENEINFIGYRRAQKEWFNNPIEEGTIFKPEWIRWEKVPKLKAFDQILVYCDPSWKDKKKNDYKAIRMWGRKGSRLYLLKSFVRQTSTKAMVCFFYDIHESLPENVTAKYYMEANFLQDLLLDEFKEEGKIRGYQLPIRGDKRKKPDKFMRIENTSPLYERGAIIWDEKLKNDPDTLKGREQLLAFEKGSSEHDDAPDADEGAIWMLQRSSRSSNAKPVFGGRTHRNEW